MAKNLPDPSRRSFITRLTKSFLEMAREVNRLAEEWQGRNTVEAILPTEASRTTAEERAAAIDALFHLPVSYLIYLLTFDPPRAAEKVVPLPAFLPVPTWTALLGADPLSVAEELQQLGLLVRAELMTHLTARDFTRTELQTMLRARQLPVSGNKEELLERLVQADEPGLWAALTDLILWQCTPWAKDKAKMRLEEVLTAQSVAEGQPSLSAPMSEVIKWILLAAAGGFVGNRADSMVMAAFASEREQNINADSTPPPDTTPDSPLPTPPSNTPVPEPPPAPTLQSTPRPRSTPIPPLVFDWVTISAGEFWMGSDKRKDQLAYDNETPQHKIYLPTYRIARIPVTVAQFDQFVKATGYQTIAEKEGWAWGWTGSKWEEMKGAYWAHPRGPASHVYEKADHPVTCVSWLDAHEFCRWSGVRLPSEAEWEKAARGTDGRIYPWGNEAPDEVRCNFNMNVKDTMPVDYYPQGKSFYGVWDMAGNVWEWTSSLFKNYPYDSNDGREDPAVAGRRVVRGGSFVSDLNLVRSASRVGLVPDFRFSSVGFRVVAPGS